MRPPLQREKLLSLMEALGRRVRCLFITSHGKLEFFHYDPYSQALSKIERGHPRDLKDVEAMLQAGLIRKEALIGLFQEIEPQLIRYPSLDHASFRAAVIACCGNDPDHTPNTAP